MTKEEQQRMKARLIEVGIWRVDDLTDPTTDAAAARQLEQRASAAFDVEMAGFEDTPGVIDRLLVNSVTVSRGGKMLVRVFCRTYAEAVCRIAVALASFLTPLGATQE